ncbi:hypothetical protein T803_02846 [Staphylococcus aureus SCOA6006]|uniref:MATE family efflux transporter n=1 Tax=Staphylococcus TaxID=1279 RepID=UPI00044BE642|nr:MATE family efflux transporter [Staphylococcus aureus]EVF06955.1 hypothetical protein T803_02846 [Staphylococcus aureus SCOA6006]COX31895.1 Multi antimicrobial extrusion protein (Na(+)/drug antiporter)%2C MATE family of MDR efflux pumps [Staphylococcus aureus]COY45126.1 Multi antimicrobial extrusion protein (Na(+)/drug antiporter)%2C MATE family of MDR efflux pumps [Staphylococcus aureus]
MEIEDIEGEKTLKQKIWIILALAVPAMIENSLQMLVGFVDTLFVSKISLNAVTAVGIANTVLAIYIAIFMAIGVGTSSLIARAIGSRNINKAKDIANKSTILSIIVGLILGIVSILFSKQLLMIMGANKEVLNQATLYFQIVSIPSIFISLMFSLSSILRGAGDTKSPMKIGWWVNAIHIILDYILIFGISFIPGLGIIGAAIATVIARLIGVVLTIFYLKKSKLSFSFNFKIKLKELMPIINLSTPAAIERLIMRVGQVVYVGLIVKISSDTYAAHTIAGNIETFAYMPGYGLAIAATTIVGQYIGTKKIKESYQMGMLTTYIGIFFMSLLGIAMFVFAPLIAKLFTTENHAINMVVTALRIDAFAQPALAIGLILVGALQGAGDTKSPMYSTAIGMWIIRVLGVYILGVKLNWGIAGVWIAIALDLYIRAIFLHYRYKTYTKKLI